jgi:hypothetical protein
MHRRVRAWLAQRVKPFERRWIPDPRERAHHETIVIRRLEQVAARIAGGS